MTDHDAGYREGIEAAAKILQGWIDQHGSTEIEYTSAREYASDAIRDCLDLVNALPLPSTPDDGKAVAVQPLEWRQALDIWFQDAMCPRYEITPAVPDGYRLKFAGLKIDAPNVNGTFDTVDAAKAVAQSDHEQRIRSALTHPSASDCAIREAAIRECIEAAKSVGNFGDYQRDELTTDYGQPRFDILHSIIDRLEALTAHAGDAAKESGGGVEGHATKAGQGGHNTNHGALAPQECSEDGITGEPKRTSCQSAGIKPGPPDTHAEVKG